MKLEDKELCKKCGGRCCKNAGCDFSAQDFKEISIDELQKQIDSGKISIVVDVILNEKKELKFFLSVKMRNVGAPAIDFINFMPQPCSALTDEGCTFTFEDRPSGGRNLIPMTSVACFYIEDVYYTWEPYQNILEQLVILNTGLTAEEKTRERIEDIFYEYFQIGRFDFRNSDFSRFLSFFPPEKLVFFRNEIARALKRCQDERKLNRTNFFYRTLNKK